MLGSMIQMLVGRKIEWKKGRLEGRWIGREVGWKKGKLEDVKRLKTAPGALSIGDWVLQSMARQKCVMGDLKVAGLVRCGQVS